MINRVCTLYIPVKLIDSESTRRLAEKLSQALKRAGLALRIVTTEIEPRMVLVTPFGTFENGEINILIRVRVCIYLYIFIICLPLVVLLQPPHTSGVAMFDPTSSLAETILRGLIDTSTKHL